MGCFAFTKKDIKLSPYSDLFDESAWTETGEQLAKDACTLLGLPKVSPLEVSVTAGCTALPTLLQIRQVMQQRQVEGMWSAKEELPVCEHSLLSFHSKATFASCMFISVA